MFLTIPDSYIPYTSLQRTVELQGQVAKGLDSE